MAKAKTLLQRRKGAAKAGHVIVTVSELDRQVYAELAKTGAAKPGEAAGTYVVTDREAAKSSVVMPKVLDRLGAKGLRLLAVNKMECFIFAQDEGVRYRYRVLTPPELDRIAIGILQAEGQLSLAGFEGKATAVEVLDPEAGKIQTVLPKVLASVSDGGWELCAISGPQLYIFIRAED